MNTPDPIFAAIERHRETIVACRRAQEVECGLWKTLPGNQRKWSASAHDLTPPDNCSDAPEWIALQQAIWAAIKAELAAALAILDATPTTIAGVSAVLRYVHDHGDSGGYWPDGISQNAAGTFVAGEACMDISRDWVTQLSRVLADALDRVTANGGAN